MRSRKIAKRRRNFFEGFDKFLKESEEFLEESDEVLEQSDQLLEQGSRTLNKLSKKAKEKEIDDPTVICDEDTGILAYGSEGAELHEDGDGVKKIRIRGKSGMIEFKRD